MTQTHHLWEVDVEDFNWIFDDWLNRNHLYCWGKDPIWIRSHVYEYAVNGKIRYDYLVKILDGARTPKMPGHANKGLEYIKQECKKLRIRNDEPNNKIRADFKALSKYIT